MREDIRYGSILRKPRVFDSLLLKTTEYNIKVDVGVQYEKHLDNVAGSADKRYLEISPKVRAAHSLSPTTPGTIS